MPIRPMATSKNTAGRKVDSPPNKKAKKMNISKEETDEIVIDPHKEEIDGLIRERDEIRSKLNTICSKIIENINIDNYPNDIDLTKQEPSDLSLEYLLTMIDEICDYRTAFLNLYQETDDNENIPVQKKITQLSVEDPYLFRKRLTSDQRLTFVVRERDLWKENAELLQIMYATIVDQLEMGIFKKINVKTTEILQAHRLNLEDVCIIFSAPIIRSINDAQKFRKKKTLNKELNKSTNQEVLVHQDQQEVNNITIPNNNNSDLNEMKEFQTNSSSKMKRNVSFADQVDVIIDNSEIDEQETKVENQPKEKPLPPKPRFPLASETLVEKMDPNLRMLIVKELSKDSQISKPPSRKGSAHSPTSNDSNTPPQYRSRKKFLEWVSLARLVGINESEIDHWLSQSLQYPAGRVLSTWCNCTSPSPTVAQLHSLVSSNELNRLDLARQIETLYYI